MKKKLTLIAVLAVITALAPVGMSGSRPTPREQASSVGNDDTDRLEVVVRDGFVHITVGRPMTVRIYSILGQLVAQQSLQPGTTKVKIASRGVYILKGAQFTRRITV